MKQPTKKTCMNCTYNTSNGSKYICINPSEKKEIATLADIVTNCPEHIKKV